MAPERPDQIVTCSRKPEPHPASASFRVVPDQLRSIVLGHHPDVRFSERSGGSLFQNLKALLYEVLGPTNQFCGPALGQPLFTRVERSGKLMLEFCRV